MTAEAAHASVAVPIPLRRLFTYSVREADRPVLRVGMRVRVTFGRRKVLGTVVEWPAPPPGPEVRTRPIDEILPDAPALDDPLLELTRFVADYYLCSWGEAIEAALPPDPPPLKRPRKRSEPDSVVHESAAPPLPPTPAQARILQQLRDAIASRSYRPFLLFGATGSGKTEVYLRAAEETLAAGRGVLYLVPEIGLTPLLVSRISGRFPGEVAVLHSALSPRDRLRTWEEIRQGMRRFVVGARSAVFAPLRDPGLVVVDEEQDGSYKQEDVPRYHGRDLAVVRARQAQAVIVMGSATPAMESFHHARAGRYTLLRLGGRVEDRPLPAVVLVDMREEFRRTRSALPLSLPLLDALRECVARGEQALVLRNRRGWAPSVLCPACGERISCRRCSLALTWHRAAGRLRCHYCALETSYPRACPTCGAEALREVGEGSERIEAELRDALAPARIERMDRDTVQRKGAHEALLRRFDRGEIDVLVGTQMIAKGHDFPRVTLVGVLSADQSLGLPDFRAGERTFQLLTQVAGRAGRGLRPGRVVVQAFDPAHPVLREAAAQDYEAFYEREMRYRRALRYPPVSAMVQILITDPEPFRAAEWAGKAAESLNRESQGRLAISGPGPAPIERLRGLSRQQILVRSAGRRRMVEAVDRAIQALEPDVPRRAIHVDVDPMTLL